MMLAKARPASRSPTLNLAICPGLCVFPSGADNPCERHHTLLSDTVERARSRPSSDSRASKCLSGGLAMGKYVCSGKGAYTQVRLDHSFYGVVPIYHRSAR